MNTSKNDVMKYVGAAVAVGGTMLLGTGLVGSKKSVKKKLMKTANKALDTFDGLINGMQNIVK